MKREKIFRRVYVCVCFFSLDRFLGNASTLPTIFWIIRRGMFPLFKNGKTASKTARGPPWPSSNSFSMSRVFTPTGTSVSVKNTSSYNPKPETTPWRILNSPRIRPRTDTWIYSHVSSFWRVLRSRSRAVVIFTNERKHLNIELVILHNFLFLARMLHYFSEGYFYSPSSSQYYDWFILLLVQSDNQWLTSSLIPSNWGHCDASLSILSGDKKN